jgi:ferredoxin-nitrite reductase
MQSIYPKCNAARGNVRARAASVAPEVDTEKSGLKHLSTKAREYATAKKANKFEKVKNEKCGSAMWTEVHELSALLREGKRTFEELNLDDVDIRLKWAGLFHRKKRTPGRFMMRLKVRHSESARVIDRSVCATV